jgi:hypothetical protein
MNVTLIADSTSWVGNRLMTVIMQVPTVKLAELRTHRLLSQTDVVFNINDTQLSINANSSRAIPLDKQINGEVFVPTWSMINKGMHGAKLQDSLIVEDLNKIWDAQYQWSVYSSQYIGKSAHKQDAALLLNPFTFTTCIITADEAGWNNWFELRCPKYVYNGKSYKSKKELIEETGVADVDFDNKNTSNVFFSIQEIAEETYDLWRKSIPEYLEVNEWHIAYKDSDLLGEKTLLDISMSRCALISYGNEEKQQSIETHEGRASKLIEHKHFSTCEHQYQVPSQEVLLSDDFKEEYVFENDKLTFKRGKYVSNIKGWIQYRKKVENLIIKF